MQSHCLPKVNSFVLLLLLSILALSQLTSCVNSKVLSPRMITPAEVEPGTYSVILYRNQAVDYLTTVAFLDREGDAYTIVPQTASFTYTVMKGLSADEALKMAEQFVRTQPSYSNTEIKAIRDPAGNLLGYEVRPIYQPFVYGDAGDVLNISYFLHPDKKVSVWVRLKNYIDQSRDFDTRR